MTSENNSSNSSPLIGLAIFFFIFIMIIIFSSNREIEKNGNNTISSEFRKVLDKQQIIEKRLSEIEINNNELIRENKKRDRKIEKLKLNIKVLKK